MLCKNELINYDISDLEIKNHPACKNSKKHLKLIKKIKNFIETNPDCKEKSTKKPINIYRIYWLSNRGSRIRFRCVPYHRRSSFRGL